MVVTEAVVAEAVAAAAAAVVDVVVAEDVAEDSRYDGRCGANIEIIRDKESDRRLRSDDSCAL